MGGRLDLDLKSHFVFPIFQARSILIETRGHQTYPLEKLCFGFLTVLLINVKKGTVGRWMLLIVHSTRELGPCEALMEM